MAEKDISDIEKENEKGIDLLKAKIYKLIHSKDTIRFLKFGTVGFIGFLINSFLLELFTSMHFTKVIADLFLSLKDVPGLGILSNKSAWAAGFAVEVSIISNYTLNNLWTFSAKTITGILGNIKKFLLFNLTSFGAVLIQFVIVGIATLIMDDSFMVRQLSLIFSIVFVIIPYNWLIYNKIIWSKKKPKEDS